jgi:hypothetical protein
MLACRYWLWFCFRERKPFPVRNDIFGPDGHVRLTMKAERFSTLKKAALKCPAKVSKGQGNCHSFSRLLIDSQSNIFYLVQVS